MLQYLVVGLVVALAALYAASKYLPAAWRRRIVHRLSHGAAGGGSKLVKWFDTGASCGSGCDSCKACEEPPAPAGEGKRVIRLRVDR
jgi:hypothetical protein